ncbi:C40 family peptidase [Clostridium sp. PL3]|uniref:C40 family peptidase n=1 Tax=Clostridium thailandense TaxID=2794346 RepID=A0A949U2S5_9CLOT|nr:NlpC/P60 family protein [Clostridium thailandense]MBV7275413.1 C40 family peptidase [Clostridium thailandense]
MNRKVLAVVIALSVAMVTSSNALAAPASSSNSLNEIKSQRQDLETKVEKLDEQINKVMTEISDNKKNIEKTNKDIKDTQVQLDKAEQNIKSQQNLFSKRVRAMYINGVDSYLSVVLQSDNLSDFISRFDTVKKIVGFDEKIIGDLKDKKSVITEKKSTLDAKNKNLVALKSDNEKKLSKLNSDKSSETKLLSDLKNKESILAAKDTSTARIVASAAGQVQKIRSEAPRLSRGASAAPASSNSIVAYASNFLGTPYQWGGNGPSTFDCSGFTCYVYAHFGISLPRVASDQQGAGTPVSRDQLQPGDLVFFGSPAHHVGIYVGDGCYIHAPKTGDVVKISSLGDRSDYSGATRVR